MQNMQLGLVKHNLLLIVVFFFLILLGDVTMADSIIEQNKSKLMKIVAIDQADHEILRQVLPEVSFPLSQDDKDFLQEMKKVMEAQERIAGLAAPQVGSSFRAFFFEVLPEVKEYRDDVHEFYPLTVWINPSYKPIEEEGMIKDWEGCFSVPDKMGEVYRYNAVEYTAIKYDIDTGEEEKISGIAKGYFARVIQHEIDHLNGILYTDLLRDDTRFGPMKEMMEIRKEELGRVVNSTTLAVSR